ncbi:MAG: energy transducer TonB, partial [Pseudomonadota bacterium]
ADKDTAPKAKPETAKVEQPKPTPPPPPPVKPEIQKPTPPPKPPEKPKPEKPKKDEDPLKKIFESMEHEAKKDEAKQKTQAKPAETHKAKSDNYDETAPLSISEIDAIRGQIEQCWNPPVGAKDAANLAVTLHIEIAGDGTVTSVELASDSGRYNSDSFFASAADSAMRAVRKCSPLKNLPADKYDTWKDMTITFDPKNML